MNDITESASYGAAPVLVSHALCPLCAARGHRAGREGHCVRAARYRPGGQAEWFLAVSPLGKTPVLLTGGAALFESAVICEYLDETHAPRLHPDDALLRARQRAWMEFGSALLNLIGDFYNAEDADALADKAAGIRNRLAQVEAALGEGPYFMGGQFGMVDAVFGPVFRYFDVFDGIADFGMMTGLPRTAAWRAALACAAIGQAGGIGGIRRSAARVPAQARLGAVGRDGGGAVSVRRKRRYAARLRPCGRSPPPPRSPPGGTGPAPRPRWPGRTTPAGRPRFADRSAACAAPA